jgi:hypothetical protein
VVYCRYIFYYSNTGTYNDQVRERSLESAVTEFQRRFHISVDDIEANRRGINSAVHQVREGERSVHVWKHQKIRNVYLNENVFVGHGFVSALFS